MAIELAVKKVGDALIPVTVADIEVISSVKQGQGFRITATKVSDRSIKHHQLYWAGLIRLVSDYWESDRGLISRYDKKVMGGLVDWVALQGKSTDALSSLINLYLEDRAEKIKQYLPDHEKAATRLKTIHDWIKEEAGYYDVVLTPTGVVKKVKSINFNAMKSQEEFEEFYKKAFAVAWKYVLSKSQFTDQREAERVALEMSRMA